MTGIKILIGRLRWFKEAKLIDMILDKCIFQNRVSLISVTYVVGTDWPHGGNIM